MPLLQIYTVFFHCVSYFLVYSSPGEDSNQDLGIDCGGIVENLPSDLASLEKQYLEKVYRLGLCMLLAHISCCAVCETGIRLFKWTVLSAVLTILHTLLPDLLNNLQKR